MKTFLQKISIYLLSFIAFCFILSVSVNMFSNRFENTYSTLIMGDSHVRYGINDRIFDNAINTSIEGQSMSLTYHKLKWFVKNSKKGTIENVIINIGYHSLSENKNKLYYNRALTQYLPIIPFKEQLDRYIYSNKKLNVIKGFFRGIMTNRKILSNKKIQNLSFVGGYLERDKQNLSSKGLNKTINRHFNKEYKSISDRELNYYSKCIELCKKNKIKLYLVSLPITLEYKNNVPKKYIYHLNRFIKSIPGANYLDYKSLLNTSNKLYFSDYDHLNTNGCNTFSKILFNDIKK